MIINLTLATEQNLNLSIKDFSKIEKIYINNSILLNTQYFGLEKACKGWKFNEKSLKEFLKSAKNMKTGKLLTAFLIKFPVLSKEDFLDNINYFFLKLMQVEALKFRTIIINFILVVTISKIKNVIFFLP